MSSLTATRYLDVMCNILNLLLVSKTIAARPDVKVKASPFVSAGSPTRILWCGRTPARKKWNDSRGCACVHSRPFSLLSFCYFPLCCLSILVNQGVFLTFNRDVSEECKPVSQQQVPDVSTLPLTQHSFGLRAMQIQDVHWNNINYPQSF